MKILIIFLLFLSTSLSFAEPLIDNMRQAILTERTVRVKFFSDIPLDCKTLVLMSMEVTETDRVKVVVENWTDDYRRETALTEKVRVAIRPYIKQIIEQYGYNVEFTLPFYIVNKRVDNLSDELPVCEKLWGL